MSGFRKKEWHCLFPWIGAGDNFQSFKIMAKSVISAREQQVPTPVSSHPKQRVESDQKLISAFEGLVRRLATEPTVSTEPGHDSAALLEIEHNGQTYSLLCRKKTPAEPLSCVELSPREREIVRMVAEGYPNKAMASTLEISEWTVGTHLRRVFAKLGVSCRAAMVAKWLELQRCEVTLSKSLGRGAAAPSPRETAKAGAFRV